MKPNCCRLGFLVIVALALICLPGCGHQQELVGITIQPSTETFGASNIPVSSDAGQNIQLIAYGTFIHPPVTKDITSQVTWSSDTPAVATVSPAGVLTATGSACGNSIITATVITNTSQGGIHSSGALVPATMTANVVCYTGP